MEDISFHFLDIESEPLDFFRIKSWIHKVIKTEGAQAGHLQFIFCDDDYLLQMNKTYLSHDTYTDIITFNYNDEFEGISGEMYISIDRVHDNAETFETEFLRELHRVMIHGILHLLGYDDDTEAGKDQMRSKENYYLSLLS